MYSELINWHIVSKYRLIHRYSPESHLIIMVS